ncbi:hypothetical protein YC2023_064427 [Brassica napus]
MYKYFSKPLTDWFLRLMFDGSRVVEQSVMNSMKNCYPCTLIASEDKNGVFDSEMLLSSSLLRVADTKQKTLRSDIQLIYKPARLVNRTVQYSNFDP